MRRRNRRSDQERDTQLRTIRDLMMAAARRGAWLTLGEIARLTEIGEASVSAQLRHLRKLRHGRHRVEKRVRPARLVAAKATERRVVGKRRPEGAPTIWEYRVLPPAERTPSGRAHEYEHEAAAQEAFIRDAVCADVAGSAQQGCFSARAAASLRRPNRAIASTRVEASDAQARA